MRFEIRYPTGATHEVELQGTIAILGRDPSCDLVINDVKCSRRHAVMEAGPDGLVVRDSGSANGVFVNGRKIDRVALNEGDEVKLGDVTLIVLPEEVAGTLVMAPDEYRGVASHGPATTEMPRLDPDGTLLPMAGAVPPPAPALPHPGSTGASGTIPVMNVPTVPNSPMAPPPLPPPPPLRAPSLGVPPPPFASAPAPRPPSLGVPPPPPVSISGSTAPQAVVANASGRPLTLTVLAILWGLTIPLSLLSVIGSVFAGTSVLRFVVAAVFLLLAGISGVMGWGLWTVKPWARMASLVLAGVGILTCSFAVPSIAIIVYMLRPAVKARFAGSPEIEPREMLFTIIIGVGVLLGGIAGAGLWGAAAFFGNAASSIPVN